MRSPSLIVAIPAHDEAERLPACLRALALDRGHQRLHIVVLANNCADATATIARDTLAALDLPGTVIECRFENAAAHAGTARRAAVAAALDRAAPNDLILMTDADGACVPGWLAGNRAAIAAGADIVCGRAIIDPTEATAIPAVLHDDDARECRYATLLDELAFRIDPDPHDPWPRHTEESGASLAVRADILGAIGGVPAVPTGEDRAFVDAARRVDARIRHAPEIRVVVSGRLVGRAVGGMADTIRRRMQVQDLLIDDRLEPACDRVARLRARHRARIGWQRTRDATSFGRDRNFFGAIWPVLERADQELRHVRRVALADLNDEIRQATLLLAELAPREIRSSRYPASALS